MTLCLNNSSLGAEWLYPVVDPYRTAGAGPYNYGYVFAWDALTITVTRNSKSRTITVNGLGKVLLQ